MEFYSKEVKFSFVGQVAIGQKAPSDEGAVSLSRLTEGEIRLPFSQKCRFYGIFASSPCQGSRERLRRRILSQLPDKWQFGVIQGRRLFRLWRQTLRRRTVVDVSRIPTARMPAMAAVCIPVLAN